MCRAAPRRQAGGRAADDAPDIVHPRLQARQPGRLQPCDDLVHLLDGHPAQLQLLARRDVSDRATRGPAGLHRDLAEQARLGGRHDAVGHADAHHEVPGRGLAVENADPLQPLGVVGGDRLPAITREPHEIFGDLQAVLLGLERLDLVHRATVLIAPSRGGPETDRAGLQLRLMRERVAPAQREVVRALVEPEAAAPVERGSTCRRGSCRSPGTGRPPCPPRGHLDEIAVLQPLSRASRVLTSRIGSGVRRISAGALPVRVSVCQ